MITFKNEEKNYKYLLEVNPNYWEVKLRAIQDLKTTINQYNDKIALQQVFRKKE